MQAASLMCGMPGAAAALETRDWGHLPAVAVQALGRQCCPASKAKLRLTCRSWHDALANQFKDIFIGPGSTWACDSRAAGSGVQAVCRAFPAANTLHLISSSTRDYPNSHTEALAQLLSSLPSLTHLTLQELNELDDFDNLDPASLWDALAAAAPAVGRRLVSLAVSGCFWGCPELFGGLRELTSLTQLRLFNNPLETACEVNIITGLSQLRVLEFGLIFDGSSQHHDVPRALEGISNLTLLQELSLPMWRRSLGGRAHPLAPSLAAALRQLTQLTSLAVDGKFGHLGVVSHLTNLRRLASAAPLSTSGWEAISKLPQLTLLTSLTPADEALQFNPARPHTGLDLGMLAVRSCLQGLDVAVLQPEHLATLGQFTQLQQLTLRAASTFLQERQQALLLTALSCLPAGLTSLTLGPLLPLSPQLLAAIAHSCPVLQSLQARFQAVALGATSAPGAASHSAAAAAGLASGVSPVGSIDLPVGAHQATAAAGAAAGGVGAAAAAGMAVDSEAASEADTTASGQLPLRSSFEAGPSSSSISMALHKLKLLRSLELVLLEHGGEQQQEAAADAGAGCHQWYQAASAHAPAAAAAGWPSVQLHMGDLPPRLQQLVLAGPFQLGMGSSRRASRASGRAAAAQLQPACSACGGKSAATARQVGSSSSSATCKLCECFSGFRLSPAGTVAAAVAAAVAAGRPPQPPASAAAWDVTASSSSRLLSGLKRPASYQMINADSSNAGGSGARSPAAPAPPPPAAAVLAGLERFSAGSGRPGDAVFMLDEPEGLEEKRSRSSCCSVPAAANAPTAAGQAAAAPAAAAGAGPSVAEQQPPEAEEQEQDNMLVDGAAQAAAETLTHPGRAVELELEQQEQEQEEHAPVLSKLCLYKCQLSLCALQQLVTAAGPGLSKLQLLRLRITPDALQLQQQQQQSAAAGRGLAAAELTAQQLQQLQVAWGSLQAWHLHPHHLWGLVRSGCFSSSLQRRSSSSSSFGSNDDVDAAAGAAASAGASNRPGTAGEQQMQPQLQRLQNVSQLLSLRHLSVVSRLAAGNASGCDSAMDSDQPKDRGEPVTLLPLHSPPAMQQLLGQLQAGLQQLPALRRLLLDLGLVTPEQPGLPDACADMWTEAGEQLLEGLPACQVKHRAPLVCAAAGNAAVPAAAAAGGGGGDAAGDAALAAAGDFAEGGGAIGSSSDDEWMGDYVI